MRWVVAFLPFLLSVVPSAPGEMVRFSLEDQWGNMWSDERLRTKYTVLLIADREGAQHSARWGQSLGRYFGDALLIVGCANLEGVPFFLRWYVRARFRERATDAPVLLDWEGQLFRAYRCQPGMPTVLAFSPEGRLFLRYDGLPNPESIEYVRTQLRTVIAADRR